MSLDIFYSLIFVLSEASSFHAKCAPITCMAYFQIPGGGWRLRLSAAQRNGSLQQELYRTLSPGSWIFPVPPAFLTRGSMCSISSGTGHEHQPEKKNILEGQDGGFFPPAGESLYLWIWISDLLQSLCRFRNLIPLTVVC